MIVIGLVGKRCSGKDTVSQHLAKAHGFKTLDYTRDVLAPVLREQGKPITRESLVSLATEMRKHGEDALTRKLCEKTSEGNWVVSGVRFPAEVSRFKQEFGDSFILIAVEADARKRHERSVERAEKGEERLSYEEFMRGEELPTEKVIPGVMASANFTLQNNGSVEELQKETDRLLIKLRIK